MTDSIVFIIVLRVYLFNFWTDSVNSANTSCVCWIVVNSGSHDGW